MFLSDLQTAFWNLKNRRSIAAIVTTESYTKDGEQKERAESHNMFSLGSWRRFSVLTTDLSIDYVKNNAPYRSWSFILPLAQARDCVVSFWLERGISPNQVSYRSFASFRMANREFLWEYLPQMQEKAERWQSHFWAYSYTKEGDPDSPWSWYCICLPTKVSFG